MRKALGIRLDTEEINKLKIIAEEQNRKVSNLVGVIIKNYLNDL